MVDITFRDIELDKYHEHLWLRICGLTRYLTNKEQEAILQRIEDFRAEKFKNRQTPTAQPGGYYDRDPRV